MTDQDRPDSLRIPPAPRLPDLAAHHPDLAGRQAHPDVGSVLVAFERFHGSDTAGYRGAARGRISGLDLRLGAGVFVFLGAPEDGTLALSEALSGHRRPSGGRVLLAGNAPFDCAALRARIGVLSSSPRLPEGDTVAQTVARAMRARGERGERFDAVLDAYGLSSLHRRKLGSLAYAELRAVELALALSTPAPLMLALHEPFADVAVLPLATVRERLLELARAGTAVVVTTSSPADARALAHRIFVLRRGVVVRAAEGDGTGLLLSGSVGGGPPAAGPAILVAWVRPAPEGSATSGVRELAAALAARPEVRSVTWDDAPGRAPSLRIEGPELDALALALADAAVASGASIDGLATAPPELASVQAATEAWLAHRAVARRTPAAAVAEAPAPRRVAPAASPVPPDAVPIGQGDPALPVDPGPAAVRPRDEGSPR